MFERLRAGEVSTGASCGRGQGTAANRADLPQFARRRQAPTSPSTTARMPGRWPCPPSSSSSARAAAPRPVADGSLLPARRDTQVDPVAALRGPEASLCLCGHYCLVQGGRGVEVRAAPPLGPAQALARVASLHPDVPHGEGLYSFSSLANSAVRDTRSEGRRGGGPWRGGGRGSRGTAPMEPRTAPPVPGGPGKGSDAAQRAPNSVCVSS